MAKVTDRGGHPGSDAARSHSGTDVAQADDPCSRRFPLAHRGPPWLLVITHLRRSRRTALKHGHVSGL